MDLSDWENPDPVLIITPASDADWLALEKRYEVTTGNPMPFQRCLAVARQLGARVVVIETRYADPDYRSEHHALYGRGFANVPSFAHRLHFFANDVGLDVTSIPAEHGYIGYVVVRPVETGLVSRAMLPPPPDAPATLCSVTETVGFFGQRLRVIGVPFAQQDARLGACAHAAAWVCHYTAHLRGDVARRPRADFALEADPSLHPGRAIPSGGLTVGQLSDLLRRFDLPPEFYEIGHLPSPRLPWQPPDPTPVTNVPAGTWDTRLFAVLCRHLNGGYPVLVGTFDHAFVVIGWDRDPADPSRLRFVRHDDQRGPYLPVANPLDDRGTYPDGGAYDYGPWRTLQVPLPPKLWLAAEAAERKAGQLLRAYSDHVKPLLKQHRGQDVESLSELIAAQRLALRTFACTSESFKAELPSRDFDGDHIRAYRLARLPRHIWVVEAIDRTLRSTGEKSVLGEAIVDTTSSDIDPQVLAIRLHGAQIIQRTDGSTQGPIMGSPSPTAVGGRTSPL